MYLSGVSLYVLSDDFLVHQSHAYDEEARKLEVNNLIPLSMSLSSFLLSEALQQKDLHGLSRRDVSKVRPELVKASNGSRSTLIYTSLS